MYVANDSIFNEVEQWKVEILVKVNRSGDLPLLSRNHSLDFWALIQGREDFFMTRTLANCCNKLERIENVILLKSRGEAA